MADLTTFLTKLHQSLNILREREPKYGGSASFDQAAIGERFE
jgi:hypothetical protein